jgi:hypothetical protein
MDDIHSLYTTYTNYVNSIVQFNDLTNFKNNPAYTYMLEHVNESLGHQYLKLIKETFGLSDIDILLYSCTNDSIGNPKKYSYLGVDVSPSSLRYIFQAMLILKHFQSQEQTTIRIVEIGGGYGGLCLAVNYCLKFFPGLIIRQYNIIDLESPTKLQAKYLSHHKLSFPVHTHLAETYGSDIDAGDDLYLISNYCFSEIDISLQSKYISTLFPKIKHGFITWNNIPLYDIGKKVTFEEEYPKTGPMNLYVRF